MSRLRYALIVCLVTHAVIPLAAADVRALFNGQSLQGWLIHTPGIWEAQAGMIVGKHRGLAHNDFLRTSAEFSDFILTVQFRLVGAAGNSGIQFRSRAVPDSPEVSGYQADIGQRYWGCLYDESRRNRILACPGPQALSGLDRAGWNKYRITATGRRIRLELNGKETVSWEETDANIPSTGFIALQVHASKEPMEAQFKEIRIEVLDSTARTAMARGFALLRAPTKDEK